MNQDQEQSHAPSTTATRPRQLDVVEPGQVNRSAALRTPDRAIASGLVKAFTPPKLGVATTTVILRSAPKTGRCSAKLRNITRDSVMAVRSEVQSTDRDYPQWFGVEIDKLGGFVAAPFVTIEDNPKDTAKAGASSAQATSGASSTQAGGAPSPAQAPGMTPDDPLFSGHLATMRQKGEFFQINNANGNTLHNASKRALEKKGYSGEMLAKQAKIFRDAACNIMTLFFIARAKDLQSQGEALKADYPSYKKLVEDWMTTYFFDALQSGLVKESGWVTSNEALDQSEGCSAGDSPYKKAQGLLKCDGKLIRIHVGGHFFIGEVKGGILHAYDNQGDDRKRSGEFDLREVTPETKAGKTYDYLKNTLASASPEKGSAPKHDGGKTTESAGVQPDAAPGSTQAGGAPSPAQAPGMTPDDPLFSGHLATMRHKGEFFQINNANGNTLHNASKRALEKKGYSSKTLAEKATTFRDAACNIMTLFFIARAKDLQSQGEALKADYPSYKKLVEDWMTTYFFDALQSGLVKESGWVTSNEALDQSEGCSAGDSPYKKAQGLLKCDGKLIRIHVGGHFFIGEVKGGILHAYDNQGDDRKRSGEFDLREVTPETKAGKTYDYLKNTLASASPEKGGAPKHDGGKKTEPAGAQPNTPPDCTQTDGADCC